MSKTTSLLSGNIVVVGGAAAIVVAGVVAAIVGGVFDAEVPDQQEQPSVATGPETGEAPKVGSEAGTSKPDAVADPVRPAFDVVRAEVDGMTLIAGMGAPKSEIVILLDEAELVVAKTDAAGKFATFATISTSDTPRVLQLVQRRADGDVFSEETVILAPTPQQKTQAAQVAEAQEDGTGGAEQPASVEASEGQDEPVAPTVLVQTKTGVRVMQPPASLEAAPEIMSNVALDAISYSESGEVELSGRGGEDRFVRVYLDNSPVTTSQIEGNGRWQMQLPSVDSGVYTLRVDEVDEDGTVVSRVETPFKREDQAALQATSGAKTPARVVTVQPGSTLWAIAAERYGHGMMYVRVFEANKDRIRNPDLIFPGQVFDIPE